jgi:hypothetical protein
MVLRIKDKFGIPGLRRLLNVLDVFDEHLKVQKKVKASPFTKTL